MRSTTPEWAERWVPVYNLFEVFRPGTPPVTSWQERGILFELRSDLLELELNAIRDHVSQVEGMVQAFGEDIFREAMAEEAFWLAAVKA